MTKKSKTSVDLAVMQDLATELLAYEAEVLASTGSTPRETEAQTGDKEP